jgi:hypothetical protein
VHGGALRTSSVSDVATALMSSDGGGVSKPADRTTCPGRPPCHHVCSLWKNRVGMLKFSPIDSGRCSMSSCELPIPPHLRRACLHGELPTILHSPRSPSCSVPCLLLSAIVGCR